MSERGIDIKNGNIVLARFGSFPDGSIAMKVAKSGYDARTATDDQLVFNSAQDVFKIVASDTYTFPAITSINASSQIDQPIAIPHGQSHIPAYFTFLQVSNPNNASTQTFPSTYYLSFTNSISFSDISNPTYIINTVYTGIDGTNLYFDRAASNGDNANPHGAGAVTLRYYILQESAN